MLYPSLGVLKRKNAFASVHDRSLPGDYKNTRRFFTIIHAILDYAILDYSIIHAILDFLAGGVAEAFQSPL